MNATVNAPVRMTAAGLAASDLFRQDAFIAGAWRAAEGDARLDVTDPATGAAIARVARCSVADVEAAIAAADGAWAAWRALTGKERAAVLRRWFDLILAETETLAGILSLEQGKPLPEARGEVAYGAAYVEWFAEEAKRMEGTINPGHRRDARILVLRQPVGVVAAITPWNFPIAMIARKVGPALAAGCPVVVKPASATPLSALALARLGERAGLPAGVLSVVPSRNTAAVGQALTESPLVRKVTFTGSTEIGKALLRQAAGTVKKVSMELGGNAPVLIFDDADLDRAVEGTIAAKFRNTGQTCVCANRIYAQASIHDRFVAALAAATTKLTVGPALEGEFDQGPLIDVAALGKVEALVAEAVAAGATVVTGGRPHARGGSFYEPTVLGGVRPDARIAREEAFGPVAPVIRFDNEAEAIRLANATEFGLAAYVFTRDLARTFRVAESIEAGMVGINTGLISTEAAPFGGVKESGLGREGSWFGIEDYTELKYVCLSL